MTWSLKNDEFLRKITSFLSLNIEYTNYIFPIPRISFIFYDPAEYSFLFFGKIITRSYVFCCSSFISFKPASQFTISTALWHFDQFGLIVFCKNKLVKHFDSELMSNKFAMIILLNYIYMLLLLIELIASYHLKIKNKDLNRRYLDFSVVVSQFYLIKINSDSKRFEH